MKCPLDRVKKLLSITLCGFLLLSDTSLAMDPDNAGCPAFYPVPNIHPLLIGDQRPPSHIGELMLIRVEQTRNGVTNDVVIQASRHHIIPYNRLMRFFNAVIERSRTPQGAIQLQTFARGLLHLVTTGYNVYDRNNAVTVRDLQAAERLVNQIYDGDITINTVLFTTEERRAITTLHTLFLWMPCNIFIGPAPNYRYDDPGREIETESDMIVGEQAHQTLININLLMQAYLNNENSVYLVDYRRNVDVTMNFIVTLLMRLHNVVTLSTAEAWMEVTPDHFAISRGAQFRRVNVIDIVRDEEEHNAELRKRRSSKRVIKTLPDMPDPFCIMTLESLNIVNDVTVKIPSKDLTVKKDGLLDSCPKTIATFQGAGIGAGAAAGAITGSAVPVIGTIFGAAIGALIGFATGSVTAAAISC